MRGELGVPVLRRGTLSPRDVGQSGSVYFHSQNKSSPHQSPTFGPILYKFIVMDSVRKPRPYNWRCLWESCSCDDECNSLLRRGQILQGRLWWLVYCATIGERPSGSQLNGPLAPCAWPSPPPGVRPPRISKPTPFGPRLRKAAATRSTSRGLRGGTSSGRLVFVPFDPLEQLNGGFSNGESLEGRTKVLHDPQTQI